MADRLATYLNDHLAGSRFAIEVLERMRQSYTDADLLHLTEGLLADIESDRADLQRIVERIDSDQSAIKEAAAWVAEKASRLKLQMKGDSLGMFEALEALSLGILGKRALWRALETIAPLDARLQGIDLRSLVRRAEAQFEQVEAHRLKAARVALRSDG
jgi:hypothetical protein